LQLSDDSIKDPIRATEVLNHLQQLSSEKKNESGDMLSIRERIISQNKLMDELENRDVAAQKEREFLKFQLKVLL